MSTIADMADHSAPAADTATEPPAPPAAAPATTAPARPRMIPLPTAITAALIAGMFGMLYLGFNSLSGAISEVRGEIGTLRSEMRDEIGTLRSEMRSEIGQINMVLLDHTDRLARIETHLEIIRRPDDTRNAEPAQ